MDWSGRLEPYTLMNRHPSLQARLMGALLRRSMRGWAQGPVATMRERNAALSRYLSLPQTARIQALEVAGVPAAWIEAGNAGDGVVLYLHGGAYCVGSVATYCAFLVHLAQVTRTRVLALDYRLAPEHPFPAALEDATAAYRWLVAQGHAPQRLWLVGDSAGGGLTLATLLTLREAGDGLPAGAVAFSPWVDLTLQGASMRARAHQDPVLDEAGLRRCALAYANGTPLEHPLLSPLYADLRGLPPLFLQVGTAEVLLDDTLRLADAARAAGVAVTVQVWEGLFHVFPLATNLPEARQALAAVAAFLAGGKQTPELVSRSDA